MTSNLDLVRSMHIGERIAVKSAYTQKHGLPFDASGNTVSVMKIKATGVIADNPGNGLSGDSENWSSNPAAVVGGLGSTANCQGAGLLPGDCAPVPATGWLAALREALP